MMLKNGINGMVRQVKRSRIDCCSALDALPQMAGSGVSREERSAASGASVCVLSHVRIISPVRGCVLYEVVLVTALPGTIRVVAQP